MVIVGTAATVLGTVSAEDWSKVTEAALTIGGIIVTIAPIIQSMFRHSQTGILNAAASLPAVKSITATPDAADKIMSDKVRSERGR